MSSTVKTSEPLGGSKPSFVQHRMVLYVQTIITLLEQFLTKVKELKFSPLRSYILQELLPFSFLLYRFSLIFTQSSRNYFIIIVIIIIIIIIIFIILIFIAIVIIIIKVVFVKFVLDILLTLQVSLGKAPVLLFPHRPNFVLLILTNANLTGTAMEKQRSVVQTVATEFALSLLLEQL